MRFIKTGITLLFLLHFGKILAQITEITDFSVIHYTDENGLPQNSIKAIMPDPNGFIWLATEDGLARFDGQNFFTFNKTNSPLTGNRIHGFVPSQDRYNISSPDFLAITENIQYININNAGGVSLDTMYARNHELKTPFGRQVRGGLFVMRSLPSINEISTEHEPFLFPAGNNTYYVWCKDKIQFYTGNKISYSVKINLKEFFLIDSHPYGKMSDGQLVHITAAKTPGVVSITGDILNDKSFRLTGSGYKLFWNNIAQKAYMYCNRRFYSLLRGNNHSGLTTTLLVKDFDFDTANITTVYQDKSHNYLFLGSNTLGLYVLRPKDFATTGNRRINNRNEFYAQVQLAEHVILSSQGEVFGEQQGLLKRTDQKRLWGHPEESKFFLAKGKDGAIWKAISPELNNYDPHNGKIISAYRFSTRIKALYVDDNDILWIGGEKDSLYAINSIDKKATPKLITHGNFGEISCMLLLPDNRLMLGTKKGLFQYKRNDAQPVPVKGFENFNIRSLYNSAEGLWITTYGDGLYLLRNGNLTKLPMDKKQFMATAHCVIEDKEGFFWITTNKGLFQVLKSDLIAYANKKQSEVFYFYYNKRNGFNSNEFNGGCQPCGLQLGGQMISFPSIDGLVWFKPGNIKTDLPDNNLFIGNVELDGKEIPLADLGNVPRDFEQLKLTLTTPYFGDISNLHISYSLAKKDENTVWLPVLSDLTVLIPNRSYGEHLLTVRKQNGFGPNNFSYDVFKFYIVPAWYETWLFRIATAILLLGVFWLILKAHTSFLLKKQKTKSLHRRYHISNQVVAAINHDIQTPLHYIAGSVSQIHKFVTENNPENAFISRLSTETIDTINRARTHTTNLLKYIKSQNRNDIANISLSEVNVFDLVSQTCQLLTGTANFRDVTLVNKVGQRATVRSDAKLLSIIVQNLMDNAVKLSEEIVTVSFEMTETGRCIVIEDTAEGLSNEIVVWLNKNYKSYDEWMRDYELPDHKGLGLIIVKDLCILLKIKLEVKAGENSGSVIKLAFLN
ncbi:ligand-binding sensor domain-containing protein [Dyadobacter psychrotolerans]|uniref:Histidine kinase/HSP90-like ATPase domain-containing protein n=1 Tax=Dyadobacter psychrotolerans TaxID=2541721 RepID=A0A4R5DA99_9BACT|nr:HAMP domain-containing sensor histidine kinase [Dyadobacter psychrotolerans]TDE10509.1 hypothetical protein E0F88_27900 [Dyadobacter psychrotolerans]